MPGSIRRRRWLRIRRPLIFKHNRFDGQALPPAKRLQRGLVSELGDMAQAQDGNGFGTRWHGE